MVPVRIRASPCGEKKVSSLWEVSLRIVVILHVTENCMSLKSHWNVSDESLWDIMWMPMKYNMPCNFIICGLFGMELPLVLYEGNVDSWSDWTTTWKLFYTVTTMNRVLLTYRKSIGACCWVRWLHIYVWAVKCIIKFLWLFSEPHLGISVGLEIKVLTCYNNCILS